jgi:predicted RNA-binding Zn-ribbon protein involved in translation (DUF1610 family)
MSPGQVTIEGTFLSMLFVGVSYEYLWFVDDNRKKEKLFRTSERRLAFRCPKCRAVTVTSDTWPPTDSPPDVSEDVTCTTCRVTIPRGQIYCPRCQSLRK